MLTLYDLVEKALANAQSTGAFDALFGLSRPQANQALSALYPAFSLGLQRTLRDPRAFLALIEAARQFPAPRIANPFAEPLDRDALSSAEKALEALFGSSHALEAIASQAARLTGVPADKVLEMMPAMASAVLGGLQQDAPIRTGPVPELIAAFLDGFERGRPEPRPDWSAEAAGEILNAFYAGFAQGRPPVPEAEPAPTETPEMPPEQAATVFERWFDAGGEIQKRQMEAMRGLFATLYEKGDK